MEVAERLRVHVAFALDCCDREIVGYVARAEPLCGEHIRDLMVQGVEKRFGTGVHTLPTLIEWLSDKSIYTADETREYVMRSASSYAQRRPTRPRATAWPSPS